jgi:hypothetical protein
MSTRSRAPGAFSDVLRWILSDTDSIRLLKDALSGASPAEQQAVASTLTEIAEFSRYKSAAEDVLAALGPG